ncbi:MAG: methyltransferase family protein [Solirubrobacterales bacterium]
MVTVALAVVVIYLLLAFALRTLLQLRRTGVSGVRGFSATPGSPEWFAGAVFAISLVLAVIGPVLQLAGVVEPLTMLDAGWVQIAGLGLALLGGVGTLFAQEQMGSSWRVGVEEGERTELVTSGIFTRVRNPIFTAMLVAAVGLAMMVPNPIALAAVAALLAGLKLQTRIVEEPYLLRTHGPAYAAYAARVGRFVPGIGRLRPSAAGGSARAIPHR